MTTLTSSLLKQWQWWLMVSLNIFFLLAGEATATLLGRSYYDHGGNSKWRATIVQSASTPLLLPLYLLLSPPTNHMMNMIFIYILLGLITAGDNLMYSYGLLYLPVSSYSLICSTELAFSSIFSYFINSQKFTHLMLNSVVLLTFSAILLGFGSDSEASPNVCDYKHPLGYALTLGATAIFSLILCLKQFTIQKLRRRETFAVVMEMQMYVNSVAACVSIVGLFISGEWRSLREEMEGYGKGRVGYVVTLIGNAVSYQFVSAGEVGIIFVVSSLFSNIISTLSLPFVPILAVVFFHEKIDGMKVMALLIAFWGFASYLYQHYLDHSKVKKAVSDAQDIELNNGDTKATRSDSQDISVACAS